MEWAAEGDLNDDTEVGICVLLGMK